MLTRTGLRRSLPAIVTCAGLLTVASACSSGTSDAGNPTGSGASGQVSPTADPTPSNYLKVPKAVVLTPQGSALKVGEKAAVAWQLDEKRIAAMDLTVTRLEQVPISTLKDWVLDAKSKKATPYFVRVKVANVGRTDLGKITLPLYVGVGDNALVSASTFESTFKPCPSTPLPKKFKPGAKAKLCLVYLAPDRGKLTGVSFYTGPGFEPLTWTGTVQKPKKDAQGKKDKGKKDKKSQ